MDSFEEIWTLICNYCKQKITDVAFNAWIEPTKPVKIDFEAGEAILSVRSSIHLKTISCCYANLLNEAFAEIFGADNIKIRLIARDDLASRQIKSNDSIDATPDLSFETFIVGSSNKFAHAAALAVATNPAGAYNPLFIYGNSGLGKTHLLNAISKEIKKNDPNANTLYIKGDGFTNELIDAIRHGNTLQFHEKYREASVLLVDDIQFIAGKDSTQEEFFHTFNALYESKKQIILTSDRPPKEIHTLESRLRTRFEWGLIADVQPPDFETRIAIIRRKSDLLDIQIPDNVIEFVATKLKTNIRQLEGAVKKIKALQHIENSKPSIQTAQRAISDILNSDTPPPITVEKIIEETARTFHVNVQDIRSPKRSASVSNARQIAMYIAREITQLPMASIGSEFNGRDHSTVIYALQQVEKNLKKNSHLKETVEDMIRNIRAQ